MVEHAVAGDLHLTCAVRERRGPAAAPAVATEGGKEGRKQAAKAKREEARKEKLAERAADFDDDDAARDNFFEVRGRPTGSAFGF